MFDTLFSHLLSFGLNRAIVCYLQMCVHLVLVNHLGGLSLPRNSVVRLIDRSDMSPYLFTLQHCRSKATKQQ